MRISLLNIFIFLVALHNSAPIANAESARNDSISVGSAYSRPPFEILEALSLARKHVAAERLDVSDSFISSVDFMESGPFMKTRWGEGPHWIVRYQPTVPSDGGVLAVVIYANREVGHMHGP